MDRIHLAHDSDKWRGVLSTAMSCLFRKYRKFLVQLSNYQLLKKDFDHWSERGEHEWHISDVL